ncbi:MAG: FprA family A-type flavoprotein [Candidatus Heimdallarchaeota archaeon]|nr:FprA family A-type flavoprotein [Candidatus Heimdallarchaeota archaeon]
MAIAELKPGIYYVGAKDYDRRLFDELIPLPDGTTYNSYLVKGSKKTALIDTVDGTKFHILLANIKKAPVKTIDYLISNHTEQDHSESLVKLIELYPEAKVVTNTKGKEHLMVHLHIPEEKFVIKDDGETLSLGDKTLEFIDAPWVHWPETMFTLAKEDKIIFTCDLFGTHLAESETFVVDEGKTYESAKRYYAEIMMPFRKLVQKHLKKLEDYNFDMIGPSHGPIHDNPKFIIDAYKDWTSDEVKNEVVLPYVSMHHSVKEMVEYFTEALIERGIKVKPFNLTVTDLGELAMALVDSATLVLGTPAVLTGAHPVAVYAVYLANALRPKIKYASIIGSYGWKCQLPGQIINMLTRINPELIDPVIVRGKITKEGLKKLDDLADKIAAKHRELGILE